MMPKHPIQAERERLEAMAVRLRLPSATTAAAAMAWP